MGRLLRLAIGGECSGASGAACPGGVLVAVGLVGWCVADVVRFSGCCPVVVCIRLVVPAVVAGEREVSMSGENVSMRVDGSILVIEIDLSQTLGLSSTGKSEIVASTGGNVGVPGKPEVKVGLNVYRPRKQHNGNGRW